MRLSHILIKLPEHPTEQQLADAKEKAAKAIARVKGGEDFAKVAADVSDDAEHEGAPAASSAGSSAAA